MPEGAPQEERTESATPRRREEARRKGQVAKSAELTSTFMFIVGLIALRIIFPSMFSRIISFSEYTFSHISIAEDFQNLGIKIIALLGNILGAFVIIMTLSALAINYVQVGFILSGEALIPKFERIDPIKGFSRIISRRTLVSFLQSLMKLTIVGYIMYATLKSDQQKILELADMDIKPAILLIVDETFKMAYRASIFLLGLAILDYAYQRWEFERSLKMTRQELKEELKSSEGDPLIKSRIRSIQREVAMRRMMQAVPSADVVITNPTHIAVALKYERENYNAPKVCAKGKNLIAERIKEIARENGVPIIEDKPLAQILYKLDLDQEIPVTLYKAVAEILARVYQMNKSRVM